MDDDPNQQLLIKSILDPSQEFVCVGCFSSAEAALAGIPGSGAKLVLMDIRMPGMFGDRVHEAAQSCVAESRHRNDHRA